jgi:hypothetical protein
MSETRPIEVIINPVAIFQDVPVVITGKAFGYAVENPPHPKQYHTIKNVVVSIEGNEGVQAQHMPDRSTGDDSPTVQVYSATVTFRRSGEQQVTVTAETYQRDTGSATINVNVGANKA